MSILHSWGFLIFGLDQSALSVVSMSMIMVVVIVAVIVVMAIATVVIVRVAVAIAVIAVIAVVLVLAVVVSVIVADLVVILISVPLMFPAAVSAPVGTLAAPRKRSAVSKVRIVVVVDVAAKAKGTAVPRTGAIKHASAEPFRTIVAKGRALIGRVVEVAVRAYRRHSDTDADLRVRTRTGSCQANEGKNQRG
jgi:hypothetical protein